MHKILFFSFGFLAFSYSVGFTQSGTFDSAFNGDGFTVFDISSEADFCKGLAIAADNKIIMVGSTGSSSNYKFALARLNPNGTLDNTFSGDGKTTTDIFDKSEANDVSLQSDGKIVVVGSAKLNVENLDWFAVARYNTDGSLDNTFSADGIATIYFGMSNDVAYSLAIQPDGKIIVAGSSYNATTGLDFAIARFDSDGSLDNSFGAGGKITTDFNSGYDQINSITLQPDGKILAAGYSENVAISDYDFAVVRYNANGTLDNTFGTGGKATINVGNSIDDVAKVILLPNGKILLTGKSMESYFNIAIVRLNENGSLDNTFSTDGIITHNPTPNHIYALDGAVQVDGKILISGSSLYYSGRAFIARFNEDGSFDNSFAVSGILETQPSYGGYFNRVALQSDYKIIVAGQNFSNEFLAARILSGLNMGVLDFSNHTNALIYPNPVNEKTVLAFELSSNQTLSISICDAHGRTVQSICGKKMFTEGKHEINIDAGQLASGQYVLVLDNGTGKTSVRFQK